MAARKTARKGKGHPTTWGVSIDGIEVLRDPAEAVRRLKKDKVVGFDTETTGLSPWRDNVALVQLYGEQSSTLAVLQVRDGAIPAPVAELLSSPGKTFVVHNGVGFDIPFLNTAGVQWRRAGWHDTLVGETLLATTGRRDVSKSLRGSLRRRLGKEIDKDIEHGHWAEPQLSDRQVEYAAQDVISLPALYRTQLDKAKESGQDEAMCMEQELVPIVAMMTINGLPCTRARMVAYVQHQRENIAEAEKWLHRRLGKINLNSTHQLQAALAKVGIVVNSTAKETLIPISQMGGKAGDYADHLLEWKHGAQRIKMYNDRWMDQNIVMDWVHPHFWQCSADTTRFTCSDPNLQQIPKDSRGEIIGGVPGWTIVNCDYSQIEVRIAAHVAGDVKLMRLLEHGDVHTAVASAVFGVHESKVTPRQRKLAKAMTFLLLFGGGVQGFYNYVKMSGGEITEEEAAEYLQRFFSTFSGLRVMRERAELLSRKEGPVFIRLPNGARRILVGWSKKSTTILNTTVQGSAAVGIKYGMLEADDQGLTKYLGGQVHDELVAAVPNREAKEYGRELQRAMIVGMERILGKGKVKAEVKAGEVWQA